MPDDPYGLLGVPPDASTDEVAEAYRALAQIYHPDRYAESPPRVQAEAHRRMQDLNAAFQQLRGSARAGGDGQQQSAARPPGPRPPQPRDQTFVHYVDGAKGYHNGAVAPLGFTLLGDEVHPVADAPRCSKLDTELLRWFELQRSNASLSSRQLYESWNEQEQARYAARLGCSQVARDGARALGVPCGECRP